MDFSSALSHHVLRPSTRTDEETPLLRDRSDRRKRRTPLPWRQFSILLLVQISEPITSEVIAPFLPQLIRDIGVTDGKDSRVGHYVGLVYSLFFLTEACTVFHWSRMSDQVGRKPVLMIGLFGLSASMWCFGLSESFSTIVVSRVLNGALNGNIGVMKSMIVEITDETNAAYAWSILPVAWSLGTATGPLIGGALAKPAERFPQIFGDSAFHKKYSYFLPCSVSASVSALSWLIVLLFMTETTRPRATVLQYLFRGKSKKNVLVTTPGVSGDDPATAEVMKEQPAFRSLLIRPVLIAAGSYATYALIELVFRAVLPVFYAMPIEMGGLNLDPPTIGVTLALLGISSGLIQLVFFTRVFEWLGAKTTIFVSVSLCFPMIALFPVINTMARTHGLNHFVWLLVGLQLALCNLSGFTFAVTFMYISAAAPSKSSIGATNGLAQMAVSVMRAVGPAAVNSAFSFSIEERFMGGYFVYWVMTAMACLTLWVCSLLPREMHQKYTEV